MTTFIVSGNKKKLQAFEKVSNIKVKNISIIQRIVSKILNKASKTVDSLYQYRAKKCDYIVTIGGSLFIEPDYCSLEEYFSFKRSRFIDDKKNVILGANFGPYRNEAFYDFFKSEFKKYAYVTFRDLLNVIVTVCKWNLELYQRSASVDKPIVATSVDGTPERL